MSESNYSFTGIYLPENRQLSKKLKRISFWGVVFTLISSGSIFLGWVLNVSIFKNFFFGNTPVPFLVTILFILSAITFLPIFSAKHTPAIHMWYRMLPALCGGIIIIAAIYIGISNYSFENNTINNLTERSFPTIAIATSFLLIGMSIVIARVKIAHRFHILQFLALVIVIMNALPLLVTFYQFVSPTAGSRFSLVPSNVALLFFLFGHVMLIRWPNRGFVGMFTLDAISSVFALRLLAVNVVLSPYIGFLILGVGAKLRYSYDELFAFAIVLLIVTSSILTWFNIKMSYKFEVEFLLMKEALRVHNIDLKMSNAEMEEKMVDLQKTTKQYKDRLNYQDTFRDLSDRLG